MRKKNVFLNFLIRRGDYGYYSMVSGHMSKARRQVQENLKFVDFDDFGGCVYPYLVKILCWLKIVGDKPNSWF